MLVSKSDADAGAGGHGHSLVIASRVSIGCALANLDFHVGPAHSDRVANAFDIAARDDAVQPVHPAGPG